MGGQLYNLYLSTVVQISLAVCQLAVLVMEAIHKLQQNGPETGADVQGKLGVQQVFCQDPGDCCRVYVGLRSQTHQRLRPLSTRSLTTSQAY